jgi:hypothetical protein
MPLQAKIQKLIGEIYSMTPEAQEAVFSNAEVLAERFPVPIRLPEGGQEIAAKLDLTAIKAPAMRRGLKT